MENKKIDKRINYKIVLDTETCPLDREVQGVSPENMFAYDYGWQVTDKQGRVYEEKSFINADIFLGEMQLMKSAYYAEKVPQYWADIKSGKRILTSYNNILKAFREDVKEYNVNEFYAYNMRFDYGTLNNTQRWLSKSKYRYFFPYGAEICDIMKMANDVICCRESYKRFCEENGYMTSHKTPRPQKKAETVYRYITKDTDFVESHTGLEDVKIETLIMAYCYRQHKKMRKGLWEK